MIKRFGDILKFGEGKRLKKYENIVTVINNLEESISSLSDEKLAAKTAEFKQRYDRGEKLEELMPETFSVVREVDNGWSNLI